MNSPASPVDPSSAARATSTQASPRLGSVASETAPTTQASEVPLELSVEETRDLLNNRSDDTLLIDVREPFEYELSRIPGAVFIPMRRIPERVNSNELPPDKHLLIHCHHGGRSLRVTQFLKAQGYKRVSNVAGGIQAWSQRIDVSVPLY